MISWTFWRNWLPTSPAEGVDVQGQLLEDHRLEEREEERGEDTPRIEPMPPSTTMTRIITDTGNWNMSGVAVVSLAT